MRLLLLGGATFLGRGVADAALARGHELTLFNRGRSNPGAYPEAEHLRGDRDGGLDALRGRSWDAVVDTSGYLPRVVGAGADLLRDAVGHYVFVSSISVYASFAGPVDEDAPLAPLDDPASEDVAAHYGPLKAACERAVEERFGGRATHVRAGLIVGPHDPTGRFTYWPTRVARGGEVLVPGTLDRPVQFVDVRDLGAWLVDCAEQRRAGAFNATRTWTMGAVLEAARDGAGSDARWTEVDAGFLREHEVGEWLELPLWVDPAGEHASLLSVDASRALAAGLAGLPLADTVRDTLAWAAAARTDAHPAGVGLAPEREAELLAAWHARRALAT